MDASHFEPKELSPDFWKKLEADILAPDETQIQKPSQLEPSDQQRLLSLVIQHGQDWKRIAE